MPVGWEKPTWQQYASNLRNLQKKEIDLSHAGAREKTLYKGTDASK
jgi:hypothetical protein